MMLLAKWVMSLACRPATVDCLDDDQQMIGIPSTLSLPHCEITNTMFFVVVCPIAKVGGRKAPPFENLRLSSQLGKGMRLPPSFALCSRVTQTFYGHAGLACLQKVVRASVNAGSLPNCI